MLKDYVQPAAVNAGLPKIGWHSFRHTVSAWGKGIRVYARRVKTLLRHENIATTSQVYGAPQMETKRELQRRLRLCEAESGTGRLETEGRFLIECPTKTASVQ
ncbi:MAG: hypothetical protein WBQ10_12310 [Terriglobales bacterium]